MVARTLDLDGFDLAPGLFRRSIARLAAAREAPARRTVHARLLSLDDATLATFGYDRRAIAEAGRCPLPF